MSASTFQRRAMVSVNGLEPIAGSRHRDVYLLVETHNLPSPASVEAEGLEPSSAGLDPKLQHALMTGQVLLEDVERIVPSDVVHVFHETGETLERGGESYRVIRPQPSFRYVITHEGALAGWEHEIQGASLQKLRERLYRIAVPNGGSLAVRTTISVVEPPYG